MYHRYIPQPDGSYRRSAVQERRNPPPRPKPPEMPPEPEPCPVCEEEPVCRAEHCPKRERRRPPEQPGNFLKNILPVDFDTEDLLIVLLLLLMSSDCREERNLPLLTLALYLFL